MWLYDRFNCRNGIDMSKIAHVDKLIKQPFFDVNAIHQRVGISPPQARQIYTHQRILPLKFFCFPIYVRKRSYVSWLVVILKGCNGNKQIMWR